MSSIPLARNMLMPTPSVRHPSADETDWTGRWVCVGLADQLIEVGAVLPATIGYHATHVRRTENGLVAAINARPFGGCASIPVHCGSTRNVRCPQLACAFSADGGVLDGATDPDGAARAQFVGDGRRTVTLPLARWGPLLFVNVSMTKPPPPLPAAGAPRLDEAKLIATGQRLVGGNWLDTPGRAASALVRALDGTSVAPTVLEPNLAMVHRGLDTFAAFSRPAGHTRSTVVWALLRRPGTQSTARLDPRLCSDLAADGHRSADHSE